MNKYFLIFTMALITSLISLPLISFDGPPCRNGLTGNLPENDEYVLIWADEFDQDGAVCDENWHHQTQLIAGDSWANGELQHYTDRTDNSYVDNGFLNIVAKRENFTDQGVSKEFTSARLNSKIAFTYGRVDVRAKLPEGNGTWPAIWTLGRNISEAGGYWYDEYGEVGWPACGEIDIMEHWGNNPNVIHGSLHTPSSFGATTNTGTIIGSDVSNSFHVYSMIWTEDQIQFLIDDVPYYTYNPAVKNDATWPFDKPQFILLNVAMGGIGGAVDPGFTESTMEIDYVRIYQNYDDPAVENLPTEPAPIPDEPEAGVKSIYSDTYDNIADVDIDPDLGQQTKVAQVQVEGNNTLKFTNLDFHGIDFSTNAQNISDLDNLHLDYWSANSTALNVTIINANTDESTYSLTTGNEGWTSTAISLTEFPIDLEEVIQIQFEGNGTVFFDNIYFSGPTSDPNQPVSTAEEPTISQDNVISLFSNAYKTISGINYNPDLGQNTKVELISIDGNNVLKYADLDLQGMSFESNPQDVSRMDFLHIDYWTITSTSLSVSLASAVANESKKDIETVVVNEWVSLDIPLSEFSNPLEKTAVNQLIFTGNETLYVDNIYFYKEGLLTQEITFNQIENQSFEEGGIILDAASSSGLPVAFNSDSEKIEINGNQATFLEPGLVNITAVQPGNAEYEAAPEQTISFCINPARPQITFSDEADHPILISSSAVGNQWYFDGRFIVEANEKEYEAKQYGNYTVQVSIDGCLSPVSEDFTFVVTSTLEKFDNDINIFPNPASDEIGFKSLSTQPDFIRIINTSGKQQKVSFRSTENMHKADIENLPEGLYVIILGFQKQYYFAKFIKN